MEVYRVILDSQLGPRTGTLQLEEAEDGAVKGSITLLGAENAVLGQWVGEHSLRLTHHLRTHLSNLECVSVFQLDGDKISGTLQNDKNTMHWHGEKITSKKGRDE